MSAGGGNDGDDSRISATISPPSVELDDSEVRFGMIELDADTSPRPAAVLSLTKERELRDLRARNAALEDLVQSYKTGTKLTSELTSRNPYEEEHGYKCGFHSRVIVSMETKSVTCQVCHAELEPIDVLREFANNERRFVESFNGLVEERKKMMAEVQKLKDQRSSLRSQIKKKGGKVDPWVG